MVAPSSDMFAGTWPVYTSGGWALVWRPFRAECSPCATTIAEVSVADAGRVVELNEVGVIVDGWENPVALDADGADTPAGSLAGTCTGSSRGFTYG